MNKSVGIIGGAGPMAGFLQAKKLTAYCQKERGCWQDADFPKIHVLSYPFTNMLTPGQEQTVAQELSEALTILKNQGADFRTIACNTLHSFLDPHDLDDTFVSLIDVTRAHVQNSGYENVLVLCTSTSARHAIHTIGATTVPKGEDQIYIDKLIEKVLKGHHREEDSRALAQFIDAHPDIDAALLGCSELSVLFDDYPSELPHIIDPLDLVTQHIGERLWQP